MATTKKSIKGTQTEKNLTKAYISESMAYSRYTFYAKQAGKEQYFPIQQVFNETATNELHHAKVFFKMLEGGFVGNEITIEAGIIGTTEANLIEAAREEEVEGVEQYESSAQVADEEGFPEIAEHFRAIAKVESHHRQRFLAYLKQVQEGTVWKRDTPIIWECMVCGYRYEGTTPPEVCPGCDHPYQHYRALDMDALPPEND